MTAWTELATELTKLVKLVCEALTIEIEDKKDMMSRRKKSRDKREAE